MSIREIPSTVEAGQELEVQLAPLGDWTADGIEGVQRFDEEACRAVVANFAKDILVDLDHESVEGRSTRAYAWITNLRTDPELGLVGTFKFTEAGAEAVNSREYRFVSVAWFLDEDGRPVELDSVALTNRPNLPVRPILNRRKADNDVKKEPKPAETPQTNERTPNMDRIKELLGLPMDAPDDAVADAIEALRNRVRELEDERREAEAERFAAENAHKCDKAALLNAYKVSPEAAKALVAGIAEPKPAEAKPAEQPQQVLNAAAAQKPTLQTLQEKLAGKTPEEACKALLQA